MTADAPAAGGPSAQSPVDPTHAAPLRADLAGWTVDVVDDLVGGVAVRALGREQVLPAVVAARASADRLATLTRLLMLGDTVTRAEAEAALPALGVDRAVAAGLVHASGASDDDDVRAVVDLRPTSSVGADGELTWWMASDQGEAVTGARLAPHHVLGLGGASTMLSSATMRTPSERVLDLGTGCGIQAMHASLHSESIVATDISRRALAFAEFNRALNRPPARWSLREGSMLEPVAADVAAGDLFDLVVSNPPFVITPQGTPSFEYRHGGQAGDTIVQSLVSTMGSVLAPGGVAQLLGNWEIRRGTDWRERLGEWLDASAAAGFPLDAWVIQRDALDGAEYAETWLRDGGGTRLAGGYQRRCPARHGLDGGPGRNQGDVREAATVRSGAYSDPPGRWAGAIRPPGYGAGRAGGRVRRRAHGGADFARARGAAGRARLDDVGGDGARGAGAYPRRISYYVADPDR